MKKTHQSFLEKIGMELKVARVRKGLSVTNLIEITGMSSNTIRSIENGATDSKILNYKRIADALEVDMKNLL